MQNNWRTVLGCAAVSAIWYALCLASAPPAALAAESQTIRGALQQVFLGPGRDTLVRQIERELTAGAKTGKSDARRLEKRLVEVEAELGRLVKAIRTVDAPEPLRELADARSERDRLKAELSRLAHYEAPADIQSEAERLASRSRLGVLMGLSGWNHVVQSFMSPAAKRLSPPRTAFQKGPFSVPRKKRLA